MPSREYNSWTMTKKTVTLSDLYEGQQVLVSVVKDLQLKQSLLAEAVQEIYEGQQDMLEDNVSMLSFIQSVNDNFNQHKLYTESGFEAVNNRFDQLETRMDHHEMRFDRLEDRFDRLDAALPYQH